LVTRALTSSASLYRLQVICPCPPPGLEVLQFGWHVRQPEKRKVGGSTPPLTTSQLSTHRPVTRPNVSRCWICSTLLVTVAACSRPSFAVRWGTRGARGMIFTARTTAMLACPGAVVDEPAFGGRYLRVRSEMGSGLRFCLSGVLIGSGGFRCSWAPHVPWMPTDRLAHAREQLVRRDWFRAAPRSSVASGHRPIRTVQLQQG
jgi:hypothetical protein